MSPNLYARTALVLATLALGACGSAAKIEQTDLSTRTVGTLDGRSVRVAVDFRQHYWKDGGLHMTGQEPAPGETEVRDYDFDRELKDYAIVADAELVRKTRDMLYLVEPRLREALERAGAMPTEQDAADLVMDAVFEFGPTPAPAFADFDLGKSLGLGLVTMGMAPKQYMIRTDYTLSLRLSDARDGAVIHAQTFRDRDALPHSTSSFTLPHLRKETDTAVKQFEESLEQNLNAFLAGIDG